ncbi:hypothetical protein N781_08525 [Pontibacillus halophilus JSM 076056 = DSM 19796]|uniref:Peptide ABC transporter permease n=1 Tax=Pontibacillus halophilus JSM 076056 = DSM 19796 TaxID=1385510 RepID=A0A0A5GG58_9BACI|nr:anti-sigma-F factor Fin family protein [Pontibacillus halophilus]KGX90080.1 hypothetical protein N781_08525 [Pontibacillus halophilus JSM 076056 = DSM 19796]
MSVKYYCRHCHTKVGELPHQLTDGYQLGLEDLTEDERNMMIQHKNDGSLYVQTICENCQDTLEKNPHYHELDYFLQ